MARFLKPLLLLAGQIGLVIILFWIWSVGSSSGVLDEFSFGTPSETLSTLKTWFEDGVIVESALSTLRVLLIGWAIGMLAGILLGTVLGLSDFWSRVLNPYLAFFNGMPRLILYPFLAIWLGYDFTSKIVLVALVILVPVTVVVATGFKEVDKDLVNNLRLYGAKLPQLIRDVYGPSLASWVIGSTRTTLGYAFQAAIVAEFVGASVGLGYLVVRGQFNLNVNEIWAALLVVTLLAWILDALVSVADRRLLRWMPQRG
ncbi:MULTISPECIES: ABC transporter permease [Actinomycetes]|uniref:ABC transporter permease n=1 Tax=Actinomycetes TaxID=1760 RepID=UPI0004C0E070|nr:MULTISPECIES: ABC transporter permease [Actinomycetes]